MSDENNEKTKPKQWILPTTTTDPEKSKLETRVAEMIDIPLSNIYLSDDEYHQLAWRTDPKAINGVMNILQDDCIEGRFGYIRDMINHDNEKFAGESRTLLHISVLLSNAYVRWVKKFVDYHF